MIAECFATQRPQGRNVIKFTGQERDAETGIDFFEARYYSSAQGRFTSADEFKGGIVDAFTGKDIETNTALPYADITDPQTLNKYAYVRNNPLRYIDPTGHGIVDDLEALNHVVSDEVVGFLKGTANSFIEANNAPDTLIKFGLTPFTPDGPIQAMGMDHGAKYGPTGVAAAMSIIGPKGAKGEELPVYQRPSNATTAAQRAAVQGQPCAICGATGQKNFAGHQEALVKEFYKTGNIDKAKMRSIEAVRPECPTCSNREGAYQRSFSNAMKRLFFGKKEDPNDH